jgi:hypothetical protein
MRGNPHRSPLTVAIMHAAEIEAGEPSSPKNQAARAKLGRAGSAAIAQAIKHAGSARDAAPTDMARQWAGFAVAALSRFVTAPSPSLPALSSPLGGSAPAAPARARTPDDFAMPSAETMTAAMALQARHLELIAGGMPEVAATRI